MDWWGPGRAVFFDPRGGTHFEGGWQWPGSGNGGAGAAALEAGTRGSEERLRRAAEDPAPVPAHPVEKLMDENRRKGTVPDGWTASARWEREADIPDELSSSAWEAMLGG